MRVLISSTNPGKIEEIRAALAGLPYDLDHIGPLIDKHGVPEENAPTLKENAIIKARHYFDRVKIPTIADDSGIFVNALAGELGVKTRRWGAGAHASDEEWIEFFLNRMHKEEDKRAEFGCAIVYIDDKGTEYVFEDVCKGVITDALEADYPTGLPIAGCFKPEGYDLVYSAMSVDDKNRLSHRGRALMKLRDFLQLSSS